MFNIEGDHGFAKNQQRSNFKGSKNSSRNKTIDCRTQVLNLEKNIVGTAKTLALKRHIKASTRKIGTIPVSKEST